MKKKIILAMALVVGASSAHAALVLGELQATASPTVPAPINVVNNDLLQTQLASEVGAAGTHIHNGEALTGARGSSVNLLWLDAGGALQTDFNLDVSVNTLGYNISDVRVFTAWDSNRAQAGYNLSYSVVGSAAFTLLGTVGSPASLGGDNSSADWTFASSTYNDAGGTIAGLTGVDAIRFDWDFSDDTSPLRGSVIQEIDVIGVAVPEPATLGLIAAFGGGLLFIRRRFMI